MTRPVLQIVDRDDPRIAAYRDVREADLVGRQGLFVAEGEVVLRAAISAGRHPLESVLLGEGRVAGLADALEALPPEVPVYAAPQRVLDAIVGFHIHRGVLAIGRQAPAPAVETLLAEAGGLVLCLVGIANHDNMGGLFRNAAAFGVGAVLLDQGCCDPLYRKAIRTSVGAALRTPFARVPRGVDLVSLVRSHGFEPLALTPRGATPLTALSPPPRAAVFVGTEGPGLPEALIARCAPLAIPMADGFDSLNVAVAAGIVLHHLRFPPGAGGSAGPNP